MSTLTYTPAGTVLADSFHRARSLTSDIALVVAGACTVGVLAQVSIPMWPVSITGQTLGVMLVGAALGARRGAASMAAYAGLGVAGVPWFADFGGGLAYVMKPSFGFILGFIVTAWVVGSLCERQWDRRTGRSLAAFGAASLIPFMVGVPWMWAILHFTMGKTLGLWATLQAGVIPFIPGGIIKWLLTAAILGLAWKFAPKQG